MSSDSTSTAKFSGSIQFDRDISSRGRQWLLSQLFVSQNNFVKIKLSSAQILNAFNAQMYAKTIIATETHEGFRIVWVSPEFIVIHILLIS